MNVIPYRREENAAPAGSRPAADARKLGAAQGAAAAPRWLVAVGAGVLTATLAIGGFWSWNAGLFDGITSGEASRRAAAAALEERRAAHEAFTSVYSGQEHQSLEVGRGESLARILTRAGASAADAGAATTSVAAVFDPRRLRPGMPVNVYFHRDEGEAQLAGLAFRAEPGATVTVNRIATGAFTAREVIMPTRFEIAHVSGAVAESLYESALAGGATDGIISQMTEVFGYDVDFQRDVRPGDPFELVFGRRIDENGETVIAGELSYVSLTTRGQFREYYRFMAPGDRQPEWYDAQGRSARKFLMKTPINGARLSSGFGMRRHPIQGYNRMHRGTDFAARTGTPILAAGDGVIQRASWFGGYGNYVRIRHSSQYDTAYGHMSRFARGIRPGVRVRQGQVIGYVGSTGQSTGPHLHYEVFHRGRQINPMTLRVATGRNLEGEELAMFLQEKARIDRIREMRGQEEAAVEQEANAGAATPAARRM